MFMRRGAASGSVLLPGEIPPRTGEGHAVTVRSRRAPLIVGTHLGVGPMVDRAELHLALDGLEVFLDGILGEVELDELRRLEAQRGVSDDHVETMIALTVRPSLLVALEVDLGAIRRSIAFLLSGAVAEYEFRTTVPPGLLDGDAWGRSSVWVG